MGLFSKKSKEVNIYAPVDGEIVGLDQVEDEVFSQKMMGDGFAIIPSNGHFVSPIDGQLVSVFSTKHAYGLQDKSGVEILIHIGLDTVNLEGEGFQLFVEQGQKVKVGDKLVDVDFEFVKPKVPSINTPIIFTNQANKKIEVVAKGHVKTGDLIAKLV